jgi:hypothetical protein
MVILVTLLALAVGLLALLVGGLLRSHGEILRALHDLGVDLDPNTAGRIKPPVRSGVDDAGAHDLQGQDPAGAAQHVAVVGVAHNTLLAFLSSTCLTCREFWNAFDDPDLDAPQNARVVVVTRGVEAESPPAVRKLASPLVHTVMSTDAWQQYRVPGAPYFVLVDGPGGAIVGEGTATTWARVQALMEQALADSRDRPSVDEQLRRAGVEPGDPSLYPETER